MDRPILDNLIPTASPSESPPLMQDWLMEVAREFVAASGAIASTIWLWDDAEDALQVVASYRVSPEYVAYGNQVARIPEAKSKAPVYLAYRTGATIELENPKSDPEYTYFTEGFQDYPMGFVHTAPVGLLHKRLGAVGLYFAEPVRLDAEQAMRVQLIGTQIAGVYMQHEMRRQLGNKIAELEDANAYLQQANEELSQVDRLKGNFMSAVSHELRTPLTSIMGFAELLEDEVGGPLSDQQRRFVNQVQDASHNLLGIVDNVLDFMRLESGTFQLIVQEADLTEVIREAAATTSPQMGASDLTLHLELGSAPVIARVDVRRLHQTVLNLIHNAVKFTPAGGQITLGLRQTEHEVHLDVGDSGIGIGPDHLPRLFEKFFQVEPGLTRRYGGVGLGLPIVKAFVEAHGGHVAVTSRLGQGSTFTISLPLAGPAEA